MSHANTWITIGRFAAILLLALFVAACGPELPTPALSMQSPIKTPMATPTPTRNPTATPTPPRATPTPPAGGWRAENTSIVSEKVLETPPDSLYAPGNRFVFPEISPNGEKVLFGRYTGASIPCYAGSETCTYPEEELWIFTLVDASWRRIAGPGTLGTWSPNNEHVAYLAQTGPGEYELRVINLDRETETILVKNIRRAKPYWRTLEVIVFLGHDNTVTQVSLSELDRRTLSPIPVEETGGPEKFSLGNNGRTLAIVSHQEVWLVPLDEGGEPILLTPPQDYLKFGNIVGGMAWSSSGKLIALTASDGHITIYDHNGSFVAAIPLAGEAVHSLNWSPDDRSIIAIAQSRIQEGPRYDIIIANTDGSSAKPLDVVTEGTKYGLSWSPMGNTLIWGRDFQQSPIAASLTIIDADRTQ